MEEWVGGLWDRWITRAATRLYPEAAVDLPQVAKRVGVVFRGLGGDPGLQVINAVNVQHGARRAWLERLAGTGVKTQVAGVDDAGLRLPGQIAIFPDRALNHELYLWLAAFAAHDVPSDEAWIVRNQRATVVMLDRFPALAGRYTRLLAATLALRPDPARLPPDEAAQERAIRSALTLPGSVRELPPLRDRKGRPAQPVPLWLYPLPASAAHGASRQHQERAAGSVADTQTPQRHRAEQVAAPESEHGLLMVFRAESLLTWAEYIKVDRSQDDDPNPDATAAAADLDRLSVMQDGERVASSVRFDLDLPPAGEDDAVVGVGVPLREWDWRGQHYREAYCHLQYLESRDVVAQALPEHLRPQARRLRSQFAAIAPARRWLKAQPEGLELDIDAWVRSRADHLAGVRGGAAAIYQAQVQQERDLACLVLADLSLSTDAHANDHQKVIDVIRDSLMLFAEALAETGDAFSLCGFSSLKRNHVRFHQLKAFDQPYDAIARGRVQAIRPGYYTRLGAAIRHSTALLAKQPNQQRLLLILSDGKPHDLDLYEGRYGIEDTRKSIQEARELGVRPFCVTIDREGASYLPHVFGAHGFTLLRRADELSQRLPLLYAQLTRA
jgi:nitric oxide reductase NorD protein